MFKALVRRVIFDIRIAFPLQKKSTKPLTESEQIHNEIERLVSECECPHKFEVSKVAERKYRVSKCL